VLFLTLLGETRQTLIVVVSGGDRKHAASHRGGFVARGHAPNIWSAFLKATVELQTITAGHEAAKLFLHKRSHQEGMRSEGVRGHDEVQVVLFGVNQEDFGEPHVTGFHQVLKKLHPPHSRQVQGSYQEGRLRMIELIAGQIPKHFLPI
jgi:hypothetical protein